MENLLTAKEVMKILHCGYDMFVYFVKFEQLPAWMIFGTSGWRCRPEDLDAWCKKRRDIAMNKEQERQGAHFVYKP